MRPTLTVMTWLWQQPGARYQYTARDVNRWAEMVSRNLSLPHRLVCVTDLPRDIDSSVEIIPLPSAFQGVSVSSWPESRGVPQCFRRLDLFRADAGETYGGRFVSMDLDCVVRGPLDPLFDRGDDLVLWQGTSSRRPYNGSMLMMQAGARPRVFDAFSLERAEIACKMYIGSDQAWLAYALGWLETTWGRRDGVHSYKPERARRPPENLRVLFFPGAIKPAHVAARHPWIRECWR